MTGNHPSRLRAQRQRRLMREEADAGDLGTCIVKVQAGSYGPHVLIHDRDRRHQVMQGRDAYITRTLGRDPKGFYEAAWDEDRECWNLGERVGDQEW